MKSYSRSILIIALLLGWGFGKARADIPHEDMKAINAAISEIQDTAEYVSDLEQYGIEDYGQDVRVTGKGDCEDWAIGYRNAILEKMPQHSGDLKLMNVLAYDWRTGKDIGHAVLFIQTDRGIYVAESPVYDKWGKVKAGPKRLLRTMYRGMVLGEIAYPRPEQVVFVK